MRATAGRLVKGDLKARVCAVSIDSRTIKPNELFVAIKGVRFDGHNFIAQAGRRGAGAVLFSDSSCLKKHTCLTPMIRVRNTVRALGELAREHRERFRIPVIAVTGSNGKTTTKEMVAAILRIRFDVLCNPGTQNNYIGVPLAVFGLRKRHKVAVIELGANRPGEIGWLSWIIKPRVAIITNIALSHLKFFKSIKGVFKAKIELLKNLSKDAKLIVNKDDRFLCRLNKVSVEKITFGLNRPADFYGEIIGQSQDETSFLLNRRHYILLRALGRHNVYNALASIACARGLGLSLNEIKRGLALFKTSPMRMQVVKLGKVKIINDCYNSNPQSFASALDFLREYPARGRRIVVCGDMLELGGQGQALHIDLGKRLAKDKIDFLITVGPRARDIARGAQSAGMPRGQIRICRLRPRAASILNGIVLPEDIVLIKGSRAMKMEQVLTCFTNSFIH